MKNAHVLAFLAGHKEFHEINNYDFNNNLIKGGIIFDGRMFFSKEKIAFFKQSGFFYKGIGR